MSVEALHKEVVGMVKTLQGRMDAEMKEQRGKIENFITRVGQDLHEAKRSTEIVGGSGDSPGSQISRNTEAIESIRKFGKCTIALSGGVFPPFESKTLIDSTAVGSATSGILVPQRVSNLIPLAQRRLTIRDLLPSREATSNSVDYVKELAFTNAASPQVEGNAKAESALSFQTATAKVRTFAHWIPASNQVLDDMVGLAQAIDNKLVYGLRLLEEAQILTGDGLGENFEGLLTAATAFDTGRTKTNDNVFDFLRRAEGQLAEADEEADFAVISPSAWERAELLKDQASNQGAYIGRDPLSGGAVVAPVLFGRLRLIVSNSMAANDFLVGNSQAAEVFDRMQATVVISTEHSDFFVRNLLAIRCESREALAIYRPSAFIEGSLASASPL